MTVEEEDVYSAMSRQELGVLRRFVGEFLKSARTMHDSSDGPEFGLSLELTFGETAVLCTGAHIGVEFLLDTMLHPYLAGDMYFDVSPLEAIEEEFKGHTLQDVYYVLEPGTFPGGFHFGTTGIVFEFSSGHVLCENCECNQASKEVRRYFHLNGQLPSWPVWHVS